MSADANDAHLLPIAADLIAAYVSNNPVTVAQLSPLIMSVHASLAGLSVPPSAPEVELRKPAVPIKKSVTPDFIISLEDGKKYKSLRRHLGARYGMTPDEYRAKWGLPADYPMVAPNYKAARSEFARKIGLGRPKAKPAAKIKRRTKVK